MTETESTPTETVEAEKPLTIAGYEVGSVAELTEPDSILIYGPPKGGKTTLAGSIIKVPDYERVLHLECEKTGAAPLARKYPGVKRIRFKRWDIAGVKATIKALLETDMADEFDVVILDTVSTLQKWMMKDIVVRYPGKTGKPEQSHWGILLDDMVEMMWDLHYMDPVGISLYHETTEQHEITKDLITGPLVQGSSRFAIPSIPDMILNLRIDGGGKRQLQLVPKRGMASGSRFEDVLNQNMTNPTMSDIYRLLREPIPA